MNCARTHRTDAQYRFSTLRERLWIALAIVLSFVSGTMDSLTSVLLGYQISVFTDAQQAIDNGTRFFGSVRETTPHASNPQ